MRRAGSYKKDDEGNLVRIEQAPPPAAPTETKTKPVAPKKTTKKTEVKNHAE